MIEKQEAIQKYIFFKKKLLGASIKMSYNHGSFLNEVEKHDIGYNLPKDCWILLKNGEIHRVTR